MKLRRLMPDPWICKANVGHVSLGQLQVMSAIEQWRSAALGGHVKRQDAAAEVPGRAEHGGWRMGRC